MYRFFRGRLNRVPGDWGVMLRPAAGLVILVGVVGLSHGCKESDGTGGAAVSPIISEVGSEGGAVTPTGAARGGLQVPQTQPATLRAATDNRQPTPNFVPDPAPVVFDPPAVDLGYVLPSETVNTVIQVRNIGDKPLKITLVKPSCTCTTLNDLNGTVIPPGESVALTVQINAWAKPSVQSTSVTFLFQGYLESSRVPITVLIARPIRTRPQAFRCSNGVLSGSVRVESIDGRPFTISAADRQPPQYIDFDPETDAPRNAYDLQWDVSTYTEQTMPAWWVIETDRPDCPIVEVWVRHEWNFTNLAVDGRLWRVTRQHMVVDSIKAGESAEFTVEILKLGRDDIGEVRSMSNEFDAELVTLQRNGVDAEATVRITPAAGHHGLLYGTIEFHSRNHSQELTVIGTAIE